MAASARRADDGTISFDVTVSSPYDSPQRDADTWRIIGSNGTVYGIRELLHDHAGEQPFTRSLDKVEVPGRVESVVAEARDLANGWGGATVEITLPPPIAGSAARASASTERAQDHGLAPEVGVGAA